MLSAFATSSCVTLWTLQPVFSVENAPLLCPDATGDEAFIMFPCHLRFLVPLVQVVHDVISRPRWLADRRDLVPVESFRTCCANNADQMQRKHVTLCLALAPKRQCNSNCNNRRSSSNRSNALAMVGTRLDRTSAEF